MDQLMWIRQDIDELKNTEAEIADLSDFNLTEEERTIVERIVAAESRGESVEGMAAVAQVIRDRSQLWGLTVTEVCLAPGQFAAPYQGEISPEVVQAVWAVFDEGMSILEIPTTHFHADYVSPYWADGKVSRGQISRHLFYGE
jgi:spore germination cell wall hydrolase CwlJ-like protein